MSAASSVAPPRPERDLDKGDPASSPLGGRLGLNNPDEWWPTPAAMKAYEAAGFAWVQVRTPPCAVLRDARAAREHARALHRALGLTRLRLVVHGPDGLSAGLPAHDRALDGLITYAAEAGAELIVYHGRSLPASSPGLRRRELAEERSLRRAARRLESLRLTLAIENLAPVFPGAAPAVGYDPLGTHRLVRRVGSDRVGMCLDVGHAHIVLDAAGADVAECARSVVSAVALFRLHDNLGARLRGEAQAGSDPLLLDLHLPPGRGSVPWGALAPLLSRHGAPLLLEIHPSHRPPLTELASATADLLGLVPTR
ncbi:MAG: sugar phosphate isomerase/epimerase [Actinomycetota bacterium]|nr:sugar phosphate isomerase/epimerase [Actinomycetota bacterium]